MMERTAIATITRVSDTNAYTVGDMVGPSVTGSACVTMKFKIGACDAADVVKLVSAVLIDSGNEATKPDMDLWLFDTDQTDLDGDNAAFTPTDAQMLTVQAIITFAGSTFKQGLIGAGGNGVIQVANINEVVQLDQSTQLYGVLVARNAYTPISGEVFTIKLGFEA